MSKKYVDWLVHLCADDGTTWTLTLDVWASDEQGATEKGLKEAQGNHPDVNWEVWLVERAKVAQ